MKKMYLRWLPVVTFFLIFTFLILQSAHADDFPEITAEQLKAKMDAHEKLLLINPLSDIEYNARHIPGSVNIQMHDLLRSEKLPKDQNQLIVTYCLGRKCVIAVEAARLVAKRNYTNIKVFRDGIPGWIAAGFTINSISTNQNWKVPIIDPEKLNAALDDYLIIDIRPASIYKLGYIPGSRAIPLPFLSMLSAELPKEKRIVVVDHNGKRCVKAAQWLLSNGFLDVKLLKNGLTGYADAGFALEK